MVLKGKLLTFGFALVMLTSLAACDASMSDMTTTTENDTTANPPTISKKAIEETEPWDQQEFGYDNERGDTTQTGKTPSTDKSLEQDISNASEKAKDGLEDIGDNVTKAMDKVEDALS